MLFDAFRLARHYWYITAVVLFVGAFALLSARDASGSSTLVTVGAAETGTLQIGESTYEFVAETCTVGNDSFVAAGSGTMAGETFRVSSSPSMIEIIFGITDEGEVVPEGSRWLSSSGVVDWSATGGDVTASADLHDHAVPDGATQSATLDLSCSSS